MKKLILVLIVFLPFSVFSQLNLNLNGVVLEKINSRVDKGDKVKIKELINSGIMREVIIDVNGEEETISVRDLDHIVFETEGVKEFWQAEMIQNGVYANLLGNGFQYDLRKETEEEAINYLQYLERNDLIFNDSFLESYLYSLVYKLYPDNLEDGRPGILNLHIIKDLNPNAGIFSNGTMIISTGLLSTLNSEQELIGVLAHEISHFVLDHSIINMNEAVKREKRSEFWATLATGIAATADIYASSKNKNHTPGVLTAGAAVLSFSLAAVVSERMGLKFSREQEMAADRAAAKLMKLVKVEPTALSSALSKIKEYSIKSGNYQSLTGTGTHPALDDRIEEIGEPKVFIDPSYDKIISFVNTLNASYELREQHFKLSESLAHRNIVSGAATEEDYIVMAMTNMFMEDTESSNKRALNLIQQAKSLNVYPIIEMHKQEAIAYIRLNKKVEAKASLERYSEAIVEREKGLDNMKNTSNWTAINQYLYDEYEWTRKMLHKVNLL